MLGSGTPTPDSKLDVTGGDITVNTSGVGFMNFKYGSVGSETTMGSIQTTGVDLKINATSDLLLLPGSNVGIGTTSPGEKLDVAGTNVGIKINGTQSSRVYYNRSGTYTWSTGLRSGDTKFHIFDERSGDRVVIDDTGSVGIGTTSPGTINGTAFSSVGLHVKFSTLGRTITEGTSWGEYIMNHSGASANPKS